MLLLQIAQIARSLLDYQRHESYMFDGMPSECNLQAICSSRSRYLCRLSSQTRTTILTRSPCDGCQGPDAARGCENAVPYGLVAIDTQGFLGIAEASSWIGRAH